MFLETLAGIGRFILILFEVILIFNLMIVVHEYGHFLAARWRGLKIEKFQIWFGKAIIKKEINGVQWGLGTIPLGGFVALPQMAPMDAIEGKGEDGEKQEQLPKISPMDKIIVAFAGPLFSLGLAFCFALMVWGFGKPVREADLTKVVGYVEKDSPAEIAGILEGDKVISIDGTEIRNFRSPIDSVFERVMFSTAEKMKWVVERDGKLVELDVGYKLRSIGGSKRKPVRMVGVGQKEEATIGIVTAHAPGDKAGFEIGDVLKKVGDKPVMSFAHFSKMVKAAGGNTLVVAIEREGTAMEISVTPEKPSKYEPPLKEGEEPKFMIGLGAGPSGEFGLMKPGPGPVEQIGDSLTMMFRTIGALFSSKTDVGASHMSSAVGIGNYYYKMLSHPEFGWLLAIWFSVLLNVNLAVLNMLPFPVLDGGHITIALLEMIRRRPVNVRILEYVQVACVLLLLGFMVYVTWFDVNDVIDDTKKADPPSLPVFEPPAPPPDGGNS